MRGSYLYRLHYTVHINYILGLIIAVSDQQSALTVCSQHKPVYFMFCLSASVSLKRKKMYLQKHLIARCYTPVIALIPGCRVKFNI